MATLVIRKKSDLVWLHEPSDQFEFIIGKFTFSIDGDNFQIVEIGQSKRNKYAFNNITIIDDTTSTTYSGFGSIEDLSTQLATLNYIGFDLKTGIQDAPIDGQIYGRKDGSWIIVTGGGGSLPDQTGHENEILATDGSSAYWRTIPDLYEILTKGNRQVINVYTGSDIDFDMDSAGYLYLIGETETLATNFVLPDLTSSPFNNDTAVFKVLNLSPTAEITISEGTNAHIIYGATTIPPNTIANIISLNTADLVMNTDYVIQLTPLDVSGGGITWQNVLDNDANVHDVNPNISDGTLSFSDTETGYSSLINGLFGVFRNNDSDALYLGIRANEIFSSRNSYAARNRLVFDEVTIGDSTFTIPNRTGTAAIISQTVTNGVTYKSPSEDAVYDALELRVPYIGATADVDLGANGLDAKFLKVKGTAGDGKLGLKHQSSAATASANESSLFADSSGNPAWKNDGLTLRSIQLDNSANTATNYTTPLDSDKINIWDNANSILKAVTWANIKATLKTYFDTVYQATLTETNFGSFANGLTAKTTPLDADLINIVDTADSNKQKKVTFTNVKAFLKTYFDTLYQSASTFAADVRSTVLTGFSAASGTVTSSDTILSAFNKIVGNISDNTTAIATKVKNVTSDVTSSSAVTGTTSETLAKTYTISANTFASGDFFKLIIAAEKTGATGTFTIRAKINSTNNFATATTIATFTSTDASFVDVTLERRKFCFKSGALRGSSGTASVLNDGVQNANPKLNLTLDPTATFYLYISLQNTATGDSTIISNVNLTN